MGRSTRNLTALALTAALSGCATSGDGALGTLAIPNGETDCQHRVTTLQVRGMPWSPVTATSHITTLIGGKDRCPDGLGVVVPTVRPLNTGSAPGADLQNIERLLERIEAMVGGAR